MSAAVAHEVDSMRYSAKYREYGYAYQDGGLSIHVIRHCPFCGAELPPDLRSEWFDRLEELGWGRADELPTEMQDDRWWRAAGL
jgi:Domain of unknown function (DUF6980)